MKRPSCSRYLCLYFIALHCVIFSSLPPPILRNHPSSSSASKESVALAFFFSCEREGQEGRRHPILKAQAGGAKEPHTGEARREEYALQAEP